MKNSARLVALTLLALQSVAWAQAPDARVERDREFTEGAWLEPDLEHGRELFQTCAACHGPEGRGTQDGEIPAIAGQHGSVLLKHLTDSAVPVPQDLTDVAPYVASLRRFPPTGSGIGDGSQLGEGASVYFRNC